MQDSCDIYTPDEQPEPDSIRRLLFALGAWGAAEVEGAPEPTLEQLADLALDAYKDVAAVA